MGAERPNSTAFWKRALTLIASFLVLSLGTILPSTAGGGEPIALPNSAGQSPLARHVIIVSVDGLRPDALLQAETMNLKGLWKGGAYSWRAQTVFPSLTLPAHASMISGVTIEKHGVTWNNWDPAKGYISVPTVFSIAHQAGLTTAVVVGKLKILTLAPPSEVDFFDNPSSEATDVGRSAASYFLTRQPTILLIHFADPDSVGHRNGWLSPAQFQAIWNTDQALAPLLEALHQTNLFDQTLIIVTTDHGGHGWGHGTDLPEDMTIPWIAFGAPVKRGYRIQAQVRTYDTAATVLYALGLPIPASWEGRPVTEMFVSRPATRTDSGLFPSVGTTLRATSISTLASCGEKG